MNLQQIIPLLPHKTPMLMLHQILEIGPEKAVTLNTIEKINPFLDCNGILSEFAYIELMAQTAAAFLVHYYYQQGYQETTLGYVIGISAFEILQILRLGQIVTVTAHLTHSIDQYHVFKVEVQANQNCAASGELKIYAKL